MKGKGRKKGEMGDEGKGERSSGLFVIPKILKFYKAKGLSKIVIKNRIYLQVMGNGK